VRRLSLALFAGAAVLSAITMLDGIQPNDEGLMLQAAARIAGGEVPYRDFWWFYPPGQPLLLGALWDVLGPSLLEWRVLRVLCDAAVAVLAWRLALRGGAGPRAALAVWLAAALAMAYPSGPHPYPPTLVLCLAALLTFEERPALAGVLAGAAAFWRLEFAAYLALGILLACAVARAPRAAARFAGAGALTAAVMYAPIVALAGVGRSWDLLVDYPLTDFSAYQSLPFPTHYDGPLNTGSIGGFLSDSAENLLLFYLPLALVIGLGIGLVALARTWSRGAAWRLAVAVFGVGMAHYLITRPDVFHTAPLAVVAAVLLGWALGGRGQEAAQAIAERSGGPVAERPGRAAAERFGRVVRTTADRSARPLAILAAAVLAYAIVEGADRRWLEVRRDYVPLHLAVADGVRVPKGDRADLERAVAALRARVPPGSPTYVATRRADRVTSGYPLLYVLADRPNVSRYDIQAPGVVTTLAVQREVVADLERARPAAVVRDTSPITAAPEPNKAGRSSGVQLLDDYLARAYAPAGRYGRFVVLARR
jgi:hypothetical protein